MTRQQIRLLKRKPWKLAPRKTKFAGEILTWKIPKFLTDPDGNPIKSHNKRTMMKKAFKAYNEGRPLYKYKGDVYIVPRINLEKNNEEEE